MLAAEFGGGEKMTSTDLIRDSGLDVTPKEVGEYLTHNAEAFKELGIDIQKKPNGRGASSYVIRRI